MRTWFAALCLLGGLIPLADAQIWAIRGAQNTVYVAGSVHLLKPGSTLPDGFDQAYDEAEILVMEIDLDDIDPLATQGWMLARGTMQKDMTLRQVLGETRHRRLAEEASRLGLPIEGLQQIEPWMIALTLAQLQYLKLGFDPNEGVERQLERRARVDAKEIRGLETLDEQLGLLDALSYEDQAHFLEATVEQMNDIESNIEALLEAWREGDTDKLAAVLQEELKSSPQVYDALVTQRNKRWMPQIERMLDEKDDYLVIVGMLHLVGDDGVLELARQRGLKPEALR